MVIHYRDYRKSLLDELDLERKVDIRKLSAIAKLDEWLSEESYQLQKSSRREQELNLN